MMTSNHPSDHGQEINKFRIRIATWSKLDSSDMVLFPRPCISRIPTFKGEYEAIQRLVQLEIFMKAKIVKLNIDTAHELLRLHVFEYDKAFIVGTPGLREAGFLLVRPPEEPSYKDVNRTGIHRLGTALEFSETKADLIIIGCVAVDKKGHMIGKGQGYSDLEYALLSKLGAIAPNAVVVTLVHDSQVYEEFPDEIFKIYDVPADIIVTPTRVIEVEKRLPKPTLYWDILTSRRVNHIPILGCLFDKMQKSGVKVELMKEIDHIEGQQENLKPIRRGRDNIITHSEYTVDFSICVTGLTSAVRVRDLKAALIGRGVRPIDITWIAAKGVAILHFGKRRSNQDAASIGLDEVVARLQSLSVHPENGPSADLSVEVVRPIIETPTDNVESRPKGLKLFYQPKYK